MGQKYRHTWSFLMPVTTLTTSAPYTTGTVAITLGVVTLTAGTFPTWAADGELIVDGVTYTVNTRDSGTQVTLNDLTVTGISGETYQLVRPRITLPDDFGSLLSAMTWRPGQPQWVGAIVQVDELHVRQRRQFSDVTGPPQCFALCPYTFSPTTGQRWEVVFDPVPDAAYTFDYRYLARPNELSTTNLYPLGGPEHGETILASCLAIAEMRQNNTPGPMMQVFMERLAASIAMDKEVAVPVTLGVDYDRSTLDGWPADSPRIGGESIVPDGYTIGEVI
jgi:hypothetical protein